MINIDFQVDESALIRSGGDEINTLPSYYFTSTVFIMPVRFQANGIELFGFEEDPWSSAPIMCLATEVVKIVKELKTTKKKKYIIIEGPGDIEFTMIDNENVKIDFDEGSEHIITIVKYEELLEALLKYAQKVRNFLSKKVPLMSQHPYWGPWIRGEHD